MNVITIIANPAPIITANGLYFNAKAAVAKNVRSPNSAKKLANNEPKKGPISSTNVSAFKTFSS